jgi:putative polyketide hydroxylase
LHRDLCISIVTYVMSESELEQDVPVLIVGGSLVGLSAAMFLAARGVQCVVVERHKASALHPRAVGFTARTLEMFDTAGLRSVPDAPASFRLRRMRVESLTGHWFEESEWTPKSAAEIATAEWSPHTGAAIAQDRLEPMLRERASALGATLHLGTELVRFEDDAGGVTAIIRGADGNERTVRARFMIACDGTRSTVREALAIERHGIGLIQVMRSVLFRAELDQYQRGVQQFEIRQPGLEAFLTTYGDGRWVLMFHDDHERDDASLREAITRAVGKPVPIEILTTGRWELSALIADRYAKGHVFLAGDAAHTLPPTRGGYGANTGIGDAYNLAWKLAAVITGESDARLLDSYDEERRPIAHFRYQQTFARPDYARFADDTLRAIPLVDPVAIEVGEIYRSSVILGAGPELPLARRPEDWRGQPGTRMPHRQVVVNGENKSTLELVGRSWVLVSAGEAWRGAVTRLRDQIGIRLESVDLGEQLASEDRDLVMRDLGIGASGASLVRPDGVVAWRSDDDAPAVPIATLVEVMKIVAHTREA